MNPVDRDDMTSGESTRLLPGFGQGPLGFVKVTAFGLALSLLTVCIGSLFKAIIVHVIMDVTSGRMMCAAILLPAEDAASAAVSLAQ